MESTVESYKKETLLTRQHVDESPHEEKKSGRMNWRFESL